MIGLEQYLEVVSLDIIVVYGSILAANLLGILEGRLENEAADE